MQQRVASSVEPRLTGLTQKIEARGVSRSFQRGDEQLPVLLDIDLAAADGEFISVIGPSGCGKSTLFNILSGLDRPSKGEVLLDGRLEKRRIGRVGYMPQKDLLLPWLTVLDNTALGLLMAGIGKEKARAEARSWFERFGLAGFERQYPATLSGGMRQRAALLRTFLAKKEVMLLDEPFGALDSLTRSEMQEWLLDVWSQFRKTVIFVTHDIDEAILLSDRIYVMSPRPGRVLEILECELSRPRVAEMLTTAEAVRLKQHLLALLHRRGVPEGKR
jgi:ABC-type nitrate/sulfonate/bicarbonate transport system ATPase subunit